MIIAETIQCQMFIEQNLRSNTKGSYVCYVDTNQKCKCFTDPENAAFSNENGTTIFARRMIDTESVFGHLKAYLRFTRFKLMGNLKV